jgi:hypothetical protein
MKHLSPTQLSAHLDRVLSGRAVQVVEYHLSECAECRQALADLEAQDRALASDAALDPGDAYFESFADRVESRIRAAEQGPATQRAHHHDRAPEGGLLGWLPATRRLAIVSAAAVVVVGAALVLVTARQSEIPSLQRDEITSRSDQVARQEAAPAEPPSASEPTSSWSQSQAVRPLEAKRERELAQQRAMAAADDRKEAEERAREGLSSGGSSTAPELGATSAPSTATAPSGKKPAMSSGASRAIKVRNGQPESSNLGFRQPPSQKSSTAPTTLSKPAPTPLSANEQHAKGGSSTESTIQSTPSEAAGRDKDATTLQNNASLSAAERGRLCGRVIDNRGRPIVGAEAAIAEFGLTTVTGHDGRFCLDVPAGARTLVIMSVGFEPARRAVTVSAGTVEENVTLQTIPVLDTPAKPKAVPRLSVGEAPALDTFSTWPSALRDAARSAQRQHDRALQLKTAHEFDHAAEDWSRVLERARGTPHELLVRDRLGDARYRAWEAGTTPDRAARAVEALTAYLARAPQGASRTTAAKRLDRVKR